MADPATAEPEFPKWHYEPVKTFTGLVQFRSDVGDRAGVEGFGSVKRGEVKQAKNQGFAERAVQGGYFSHVAEGTPIGAPDFDAHLSEPEEMLPKVTNGASSGAAIPLIITSDQRQQLRELGATDAEIDAMTPQQAHDRLNAAKG